MTPFDVDRIGWRALVPLIPAVPQGHSIIFFQNRIIQQRRPVHVVWGLAGSKDCIFHAKGPGRGGADAEEDNGDSVLPTHLMCVLVVAVMRSAEKGPSITLDKLKMLGDTPMERLELLGTGKVARGLQTGVWAVFMAVY